MRIISEFDPFGPYNQYLEITHRFKGLPNYVVSDGQLIQLEHFVKKNKTIESYPRKNKPKITILLY